MIHTLTRGATRQMPWRARQANRLPAAQKPRGITHVD